ncbi:MAG: type II toxin-antitoxin system VapC family toxin [Chloroflexi bacterium]|nr:MAG: type II toxin-antitoxin system VapC family toxin [Chloroflexota bacterium]
MGRLSRRASSRLSIALVTVDTGWVIAAERNPSAARRHIAVLTRVGQVLVISPVVVVEARQRATDVGAVDVILAKLRAEPVTPEDGRRASELLRAAGSAAADPSRRIHDIGLVDAIVAAVAERLGGIVYTDDPRHMSLLATAGARITPQRTPY